MTTKIIFEVQGSEDNPYQVTFIKGTENNLSAHCTCNAGKKGSHCKHRINILNGNEENILGESQEDNIKIVISWLSGSELEKALNQTNQLEEELKDIKKKLTASKKQLSKIMRQREV